MSERNWKFLIEDIFECVEKIERYTDGIDFMSFKNDDKTVDAVIKISRR